MNLRLWLLTGACITACSLGDDPSVDARDDGGAGTSGGGSGGKPDASAGSAGEGAGAGGSSGNAGTAGAGSGGDAGPDGGAGQDGGGGCGPLVGTSCGQCGKYVCNASSGAVECQGVTSTKRCTSAGVQSCTASGNWGPAASCASGVCYDSTRCVSLTRQLLTPSGTHFSVGITGAVASASRVTVAGFTSFSIDGQTVQGGLDGLLSAFSPSLSTRTTRFLSTSSEDRALSIAPLAGTHVAVGGRTRGNLFEATPPTSFEGFVSVWDVAAAPRYVWGVHIDGTGAMVATDVARGAVFSVSPDSGGAYDIQKRTADTGRLNWGHTWTPAQASTTIAAIAVDAAGDLYAAGEFDPDPSTTGLNDAVLYKFSGAIGGPPIWTRILTTPQADAAYGLTVGSDGSVYVVGSTGGGLDSNSNLGNQDAFVARFTSTGTKSWTRQWGTSASDGARGIAVTASGELFIAGQTDGTFRATPPGGLGDTFVTRWAANGTIAWTVQSATTDNDQVFGLAFEPSSGAAYAYGAAASFTPAGLNGLLLRVGPQ